MEVGSLLGEVGLPAPVAELAARDWDAVVVGGGHNGLAAAAYLARAGHSVLVLERRERLGGACTLERPFEDERFLVSPCAYVVGLLDGLVIDELELPRHGYRVTPADPNLWCPFPDGTSFAQFLDDEGTAAHMRENGFSESDIEGALAYEETFDRIRRLLRAGPAGDLWRGPSPSRERIEEILGDAELISIVFEEPIADTLARYVSDERLAHALFGQGVIGEWAGPRDPGTASVHLMHGMGEVEGHGGSWGYVEGGMGRVSFAIADAAREAGATLAAGVPVARIVPGEGVELDSGELIRARTVVCNADPKRMLTMLPAADVPADYRERLDGWEVGSPVVKVNAALDKLPTFTAAGSVEPHRAMVTVTRGLDPAQEAFEACKRGEPSVAWAELYFQTAYDPSVAPAGGHVMSAFAQYAPYELAEGDWESRRDEIGNRVLDLIETYAPDLRECVAETQVLGPPDIEERIGLTGGNIFQGETLPDQMWDRRLESRTPIDGLYLCGAATHPAGSVIALNGRNAAMAVLEDAGVSLSRAAS
ncbi:MAG TPA: NAD(P)/FAD-dependent oxidoreductase [Solirubrobacterales bacterium]|nr:NAD(P)/FAD-dependent oxidoreductase [Solirubrobacterales bacterium]